MSTIALRELPSSAALRYFQDTLVVGGASGAGLSEMLERGGEFFALAPPNIDLPRLIQFDTGGLLPAPPKQNKDGYSIQAVPNTASSAAAIVSDASKKLMHPALWIHEPLLTETEIVPELDLQCQRIGKELYLTYRHDLDSPARIIQLLRRSLLSWHFLAILADSLPHSGSVEEVLRHSALVLVGSYDGESFLVWRRTQDSPPTRPATN